MIHLIGSHFELFRCGVEILMGAPMDPLSSVNSKVHTKKDFSDSFTTGETRKEQTAEGLYAPTNFSTMLSTGGRDDDRDYLVESKDCNYAKGRWVADSRKPLYSGFGCKQWLSEMWACRLTQRTDFPYETFKWQPENCRMPEFEKTTFLRRMQDKTVAFVGDSLGRQQFQSLICMVTGCEEIPDVHNIGSHYGLVKARGAIRPDGWAYRFPSCNTTILYYWSATLCDLEPLNITDPKTEFAMHLDRPAAFLRDYLHRFDVLVLNTGQHWNRGKLVGNRWVIFFSSHDSELSSGQSHLGMFFNRDWNTGGTCDNSIPLAGGSEVLQDESSDPVIESAVKGLKVKILDITAISQLRDEGHLSKYTIRPTEGMQDCLHWCLPGIPDTWNELLSAQL
ncbi:hypothetical protein IFM89_031779 [Coptis chinensis]|uniref:Trichome birefringence-like N-terminal domain-containing protein n=1 Tax=Coptis chinensis TaxID=261450 RepID=A0A835IY64_9MAGN|nr:hypothetical protein IFM89_031779 [Coptis chinensis]